MSSTISIGEYRDLLAKAKALSDQLELIHNNALYRSIWTSAAIHGIDYSLGPKYDKELSQLQEAIRKGESLSGDDVTTFHNCGDSEQTHIEDSNRLNCPFCGGSGHRDDIGRARASWERLATDYVDNLKFSAFLLNSGFVENYMMNPDKSFDESAEELFSLSIKFELMQRSNDPPQEH